MKDIWTVALDFSNTDNTVMGYVKFLASHLHPKEIHFVHVTNEPPSYSYLPEEYLGFQDQILADDKLKLEFRVDKVFKDSGLKTISHVLSGSPFDTLIDLVISKSSSLVVVGRKKTSGGSGIVSERLSRNLPCDFLLVPEGFKPAMKNILVSTDFSEHSSLAMQKAHQMKDKNKNLDLFAQHCYEVPMGYSKSGKSFDEFAEIMRYTSDREMTRWLKPFSYKIKPVLTLAEETSVTEELMKTVNEQKIDLIIVGSKGQTKASIALLGSLALKLLHANDKAPLWIVKKEGENIDLLDALKRI